jgi:hypothetical protein
MYLTRGEFAVCAHSTSIPRILFSVADGSPQKSGVQCAYINGLNPNRDRPTMSFAVELLPNPLACWICLV